MRASRISLRFRFSCSVLFFLSSFYLFFHLRSLTRTSEKSQSRAEQSYSMDEADLDKQLQER